MTMEYTCLWTPGIRSDTFAFFNDCMTVFLASNKLSNSKSIPLIAGLVSLAVVTTVIVVLVVALVIIRKKSKRLER